MTPDGWKHLRLADIAKVLSGVAFPRVHQGSQVGMFPFFKVSDMNTRGNETELRVAANTVDDDLLQLLKAKLHPPGAVVFPKVGATLLTNKRRRLVVPSTFDNNIMGLVASGCQPEYLYLIMQTIDFAKYVQPGAIPSINSSMVGKIRVLVPTLREQRKIAAILSSINEAIEKTHAIIDQVQIVIRGLMQELLTRGLTGGHRRFRETAIGEIPKEWEVRPISDTVTKLAIGKRYDRRTRKEHGKIPIVDQSEAAFFGYHDDDPGIHASNDLPVVTFANHTCAVRWHTRSFSVIQNVFPLKGASGITSRYLFHLLRTAISPQGYKGHWPLLMETLVPVPSEEEQTLISRVVDSIEDRIGAELGLVGHLSKLRSELMSVLLTGELRVTPDNERA